jgi:hypothetical protein
VIIGFEISLKAKSVEHTGTEILDKLQLCVLRASNYALPISFTVVIVRGFHCEGCGLHVHQNIRWIISNIDSHFLEL